MAKASDGRIKYTKAELKADLKLHKKVASLRKKIQSSSASKAATYREEIKSLLKKRKTTYSYKQLEEKVGQSSGKSAPKAKKTASKPASATKVEKTANPKSARLQQAEKNALNRIQSEKRALVKEQKSLSAKLQRARNPDIKKRYAARLAYLKEAVADLSGDIAARSARLK